MDGGLGGSGLDWLQLGITDERNRRAALGESMDKMDEIEFMVEELPEGGYVARAFGACIMTEADSRQALHAAVREAVCCHFDDGCQPRRVRLKFSRVVAEEVVEV